MTINHVFLAFMGLVGAAIGIILVVAPQKEKQTRSAGSAINDK